MEQQIRFCTASDGVSIAYAAVGEGYPLVRALGWFTHLEYEWKTPLWRHVIEGLAARHQLVRYDGRGTGLSDRSVFEHSVDQWVTDLESVVDALQLSRFALLGISQGGATAITYAVRHPERVSHLVLYGSFARWPFDLGDERVRQYTETLITLIRLGWGSPQPAARQTMATYFIPSADAEQTRAFTDLERASTSPENAASLMESFTRVDVTDQLSRVSVPTLVLHRRGDAAVPFEAGRELAAQIPNSRFVPLDGDNHLYLEGERNIEQFFQALDEFVGAEPTGAHPAPSGLVTILFTDMEGSTTMTQRLGDEKAQELLRTHNTIVRGAIKTGGGVEIKHTGDGLMASFPTASRALECAVAIQQRLADHNETAETPVRVRIGLNAGEPVAEDADLFGTAVQLAARVCARAEPGQVLASNVVRELAAGKGFLFSDIGDIALRGFEDPVRLFEVRGG